MPIAISRLPVVPWHVVALQEPCSHLTSDALAVHIQASQNEDCGVLFSKNTFSRVKARRVFVGQVHEYTDWALCGFCAQAWFRRASTGKRIDVRFLFLNHVAMRKSAVTNIFLVACGVQGIVESAGGRQSWESAFPVTLPNLGALETKVWIVH